MAASTTTVNNFIIWAILINPLTDIVSKLKTGNFRDCDIKWLDGKLCTFTELACKTLSKDLIIPDCTGLTMMNNYATDIYINRFETLLGFFETF